MANDPNKNTKSWIYRLKHLRIRRNSEESSNNEDFTTVIHRRPLPALDSDSTTCSGTRNSFRKSLRKMHTRVKSVFMSSSATPSSRHTVHISSISPSSSQSRVTLTSPTMHSENIYSSEPVTRNSNGHTNEDTNLELPQRVAFANELYSNCNGNASDVSDSPIVTSRTASRRNFPQLFEVLNGRVPKAEVVSLSSCYWYWGPITRTQAEDRLRNFPDGAFIIRDSSSNTHIFTMSFRSVGRTLHTRIELNKNGYSLLNLGGYHSIAELVDDALKKSKNGIYCYTKSTDEISPNYPVRLTLPVSRYDKVPSLKHLSRFVVRRCININDIDKLPLPRSLIAYLKEDGVYF